MWFWIGVGSGSFIALSLLIALAFARVLGALNGEMVELLEGRTSTHPPSMRSRSTSSTSSEAVSFGP
jgi:hypothetical protein